MCYISKKPEKNFFFSFFVDIFNYSFYVYKDMYNDCQV